MGKRRIVPLVVFVALSQAAAAGAREPILWQRDYAFKATKQRDWVRRRIRQILAPTLTFPSLARLGGKFTVLLKVRKGPHLKRLNGHRPETWAVELVPAHGARTAGHPCRVEAVR